MSRALLLLLLSVPLVAALAASCQDFPPVETCGEIPAGGCPVGRGGTCADTTCAALWDCVGGAWVHTQTCPSPDGGEAGDGGPGDAGAAGSDGGTCTPVTVDTSGEIVGGCTPGLDPSQGDCPVEAAEGCAESACLTGCSTFFLCSNAGCMGAPGPCWTDVAYCDDDGGLVVTRP